MTCEEKKLIGLWGGQQKLKVSHPLLISVPISKAETAADMHVISAPHHSAGLTGVMYRLTAERMESYSFLKLALHTV